MLAPDKAIHVRQDNPTTLSTPTTIMYQRNSILNPYKTPTANNIQQFEYPDCKIKAAWLPEYSGYASFNQPAISVSLGTRPEDTTMSLMTSPGVARIGHFIISPMSVTFSISASICSSSTALRAFASSLLQFAQPEPNTFMLIIVTSPHLAYMPLDPICLTVCVFDVQCGQAQSTCLLSNTSFFPPEIC